MTRQVVEGNQPFVLPELRLSTSARLSPHVPRARVRARGWARAMGMVDSAAVWTQADLDAHDYPLMSGYIHPDAGADELELIAEWYTWVFYFDDNFLELFKKTGDRAGAVAHLDRVTALLSTTATASTTADPVEAGLADLWARTAPGMSECWRARFVTAAIDLLEESLAELDSIAVGRGPDPLEYLERRRRVGGAPWSAVLVEHTVGEIPPRLVDSRPVRVLTETFADAVHLRNDLFSYQREVDQEGELYNAVLVAMRFLGWPVQRAAQFVADLITSRLRLFEHAATIEVAGLFADENAGAGERRRVLAYAQGLRDWQSGGHEWHARSTRYMNTATRARPTVTAPVAHGPGTAAARLVRPIAGLRPRQTHAAGRQPPMHRMPPIPVPFPLRISPHLDRARAQVLPWARRLGLFDPVPGVPNSHVWTAQDVVEFDIALCAAAVFPDAAPEQVELVSN